MNCPNCRQVIRRGSVCAACGTDAYIYTKTVQLSDSLYNKGLSQAKMGNLSGAIESLSKSVSYNKHNTNARNLLGLVYFEYGKVADALKQWIISASLEKDNNLASDYINRIQNNTQLLEKYGESINNYNQALVYINQKSEDMAIIQLKKAIELNPNFVDALNLLALCYLILKEKDRAVAHVEKAMSIDSGNAIAFNYYQEIYQGRSRADAIKRESRTTQAAPAQKRTSTPYLYTKPKKSIISINSIASVLLFIIGVACTFAYFSVLVLPQTIEDKDKVIAQMEDELKTLETSYTNELKQREEETKTLETQITKLNQEKTNLNDQLIRQEKIQKVNTAYNFYRDNNLEDAADILNIVDVTGLPVDTVELYERIVSDAYPKLAQSLYNTGVNHCNRREYDDAKLALEKALHYVAEDSTIIDDIKYYLGYTAEMQEDFITAIEYYADVVDNYPNSNLRNYANNRMKGLQQ